MCSLKKYLNLNFQIQIRVIDINNKDPTLGTFNREIELYENITTGTDIERIITIDLDRDGNHQGNILEINFIKKRILF